MRDRRFVAVHRGGPLDRGSHIILADWAGDCASGVLHLFSQISDDQRPRDAIAVLRAWTAGEVKTGIAMEASVAAHAAAREVKDEVASSVARAAAHAVATAHFADHCMGALLYGLKARERAGDNCDKELQLRLGQLPEHLREIVEFGVAVRLRQMGIKANAN